MVVVHLILDLLCARKICLEDLSNKIETIYILVLSVNLMILVSSLPDNFISFNNSQELLKGQMKKNISEIVVLEDQDCKRRGIDQLQHR